MNLRRLKTGKKAEREREGHKKGTENKRTIQAKAPTVRDLHCAAVYFAISGSLENSRFVKEMFGLELNHI